MSCYAPPVVCQVYQFSDLKQSATRSTDASTAALAGLNPLEDRFFSPIPSAYSSSMTMAFAPASLPTTFRARNCDRYRRNQQRQRLPYQRRRRSSYWSASASGNGNGVVRSPEATNSRCAPHKIRIAVPSKGDMHKLTRMLLDDVGLSVILENPRQYEASVQGLDVQVWLQRPVDIVRKVASGDVDLGFVGTDLVAEYGGGGDEIIAVHDNLEFGQCRLSVGVPTSWGVDNMDDLRKKSQGGPLRVATKFKNETGRFFKEHNISNYEIVYMDGALEASTSMGTADCIVDLVSSGTTLRENLLKEISGGTVLSSSMQLVGSRKHLGEMSEFGERLRTLTRELLERIDAHLLGRNTYNIIANIRGSSMVDVSRKLSSQTDLQGVDGPTVSPVVPPADSDEGMYAISIVLPKEKLYSAVRQLRRVGGSGVTVLPVKFVFPGECVRWKELIRDLGVEQDEYAREGKEKAAVEI